MTKRTVHTDHRTEARCGCLEWRHWGRRWTRCGAPRVEAIIVDGADERVFGDKAGTELRGGPVGLDGSGSVEHGRVYIGNKAQTGCGRGRGSRGSRARTEQRVRRRDERSAQASSEEAGDCAVEEEVAAGCESVNDVNADAAAPCCSVAGGVTVTVTRAGCLTRSQDRGGDGHAEAIGAPTTRPSPGETERVPARVVRLPPLSLLSRPLAPHRAPAMQSPPRPQPPQQPPVKIYNAVYSSVQARLAVGSLHITS